MDPQLASVPIRDYILLRAPNGVLWDVRVNNDGSLQVDED
jgi:hypothetical protein